MVAHLNSESATMMGDNQPSFDQVVEENLLRGLYLVQLQALQRCIKDPRLKPRHRLVLVALSECTNGKSGMAYPGYAWLAANVVYYDGGEAKRYPEGTIANVLSELADFGYLVSKRRAPAAGGRALAHYAITPPSLEDLQAKIADACAAIRAAPKRRFPGRSELNSGIEINTGVDVTPDLNSRVAADFNTRGAQELGEGTGREEKRVKRASPLSPSSADAHPSYSVPPAKEVSAFESYNALALRCGLPQAAKLTPAREREIKARLREYGVDGWARALANIERSKFLRGTNDRNWCASLDFMLKASSFSKLHDGGYGNGAHARHVDPGEAEAQQRLDQEYAVLARQRAEGV